MVLSSDMSYVSSLVDSLVKSYNSGEITAYIVTAIVEEEVDPEYLYDTLVLTNVTSRASYRLPEDARSLLECEQELASMVMIHYDDDGLIDSELLMRDIQFKASPAFCGDKYTQRYYLSSRKPVQTCLTKSAAEHYIANHQLKDPLIEERDLYTISEELHSFLSCLIRYRMNN